MQATERNSVSFCLFFGETGTNIKNISAEIEMNAIYIHCAGETLALWLNGELQSLLEGREVEKTKSEIVRAEDVADTPSSYQTTNKKNTVNRAATQKSI